MDVLIRFGFSIEEIKNMMDTNIGIDAVNEDNLQKLINILNRLGCKNNVIKNILVANPFYLNRNVQDIEKIVELLGKIKMTDLNMVFDSNPFMLNLDVEELESLITKKSAEGLNEMEIIDYLSYNIL